LDKENRKERISDHGKVMQEIEDYFERAQHYAHVKGLSDENNAPTSKRDIQLEAMVPYVAGDAPVLFRANTYKEIMGALRFSKAYEFRPVIVGRQDAWKCAAELKAGDVPVIVTSVFSRPGEFDPYDAAYANAGKLEAAGVRFCIAVSGAADVKQLPSNLGMAVAHGLSEDGAVHSVTLGAAHILGIEEATGSLEVGKVAGLIITTGHLGQANTRTVASFIGGKPVPLTSLHEENCQRFRHRPAPELGPKPELASPPPMRLNP
jgi:hypothetical protein